MSNVSQARFNGSQEMLGEVIDLKNDGSVQEIVSIVKFKDGSIDVYGSMGIADLCFGVKILERVYVKPCIDSMID